MQCPGDFSSHAKILEARKCKLGSEITLHAVGHAVNLAGFKSAGI